MRLYALVQSGDPEAIDVYLAEEDAQRALENACGTSPSGADPSGRGGRARPRTHVAQLATSHD